MMLPFRSRSENTGHNRYPGALTRRLRSVLCWYFAFDSSVSLQSVAQDILRTVHRQNAAHPLSYLPGAALYSLAAIVSAMAWWTVWKRKASARRWALAISVWNVLVGAPLFYYWLYGWSGYWQLFLGSLWLPTLAGVVGLGAFLRPLPGNRGEMGVEMVLSPRRRLTLFRFLHGCDRPYGVFVRGPLEPMAAHSP
jgi:hypothetical protein